MRKRKTVDDEKDDDDMPVARGRPRTPEELGPPKPEPHQRKEFVTRLQSILDALEIPDLGRDERMYLQRVLWRADRLCSLDPKRFTVRGEDRVILLLRSIAETTNGAEALTLPIMRAVSFCLHDGWTNRGLAWLEALDCVPLLEILRTLSNLGLQGHLEDALRWKLTQILGSPFKPQPAKLPKVKREPKPPASLTRVRGVEKNVQLGLELLALRSAIKSHQEYGRQVRRKFDIETKLAVNALKVARRYGARPEIFTRLSWNALAHLASPTLPAGARQALERRIIAGERIGAPEIRRAHGELKAGKRGRQADQQAQRSSR